MRPRAAERAVVDQARAGLRLRRRVGDDRCWLVGAERVRAAVAPEVLRESVARVGLDQARGVTRALLPRARAVARLRSPAVS